MGSPGITYLVNHSSSLGMPPATTFVILSTVRKVFEVRIPVWVSALAYMVSIPIWFYISISQKSRNDSIDAANKDCVLPPRYMNDYSFLGLPTIRNRMKIFNEGYPTDGLEDVPKTVIMRAFFEHRVLTSDPDLIKSILATNFDKHEKASDTGEEILDCLVGLLGVGVFNSDGSMWKFHRDMTRPFFSKDRVSDFSIFGRHADDALDLLRNRLAEGFPVDFQDLASRFTLDSATEFLMGSDVCSLSAGIPHPFYSPLAKEKNVHPSDLFARAFAEAQYISAIRLRYGFRWPLGEFWEDKLITGPMATIRKFIDPLVDDILVKKQQASKTRQLAGLAEKEKPTEIREGVTLLEHLAESTDDKNILRDETLNILIAGRDGVATTITFVVYMLAEHPDVLKKLRDEILSTVGRHRYPTFEDIKGMKYLKAVLNETLRLYPPVPFNLRVTKAPLAYPSKIPGEKPLFIPADTRVVYSVMVMQRDPDLWGPDANEFDPDRFIDERLAKYLTPKPFIFLPFNAGPRICLGQQFAYKEASFFLIRLLQKFSGISLAPEAQPIESRPPANWAQESGRKSKEKIRLKMHLTMYTMGGLWVKLEPAED